MRIVVLWVFCGFLAGCESLTCLMQDGCPFPPRIENVSLDGLVPSDQGITAVVDIQVVNPNPMAVTLRSAYACVQSKKQSKCLFEGKLIKTSQVGAETSGILPVELSFDWTRLGAVRAGDMEICSEYVWSAVWWLPARKEKKCKELKLPDGLGFFSRLSS